jgi:thiamine transport system permease protein
MRWLYRLPYLLPLVFTTIFFVYPLLSILLLSFSDGGVIENAAVLITSSYYRETLMFTVGQAALSTVLTLLLALPGAYVFARYDFPFKRLLSSLALLPFILPTVVVAAAFTALIGERGVLNSWLMGVFGFERPPIQLEETLTVILIAHVFYNYPVALRLISGFWANVNTRMEEAARVSGVSGWALWQRVHLPILRPAISAAAALVFVFTFTSFGVILILGGLRFSTIEVEIYRQTITYFNLPMAALLSMVQLGVVLVLMLIYTRTQRRIALEWRSVRSVAQRPRSWQTWSVIGVNLLLISALLFAPLMALTVRSFSTREGTFTLQHYLRLGENPQQSVLRAPPLEAVGTSLTFALSTMALATLLGVTAAFLLRGTQIARWFEPLFMLPLATSAVTMGFGFLITFDEPPLRIITSPTLILIAHTLIALPFVVRSVLPALRAIPPRLNEAAAVMGASPIRRWWRIEMPLIRRGILVGATFAFTVSIGEFGASAFLLRGDVVTLPVMIFRLLGQPGSANYGQALALCVLLMGICAACFVLIEQIFGGSGEF